MVATQKCLSIVTVPGAEGTQAPLAIRAQQSMAAPGQQPQKPGHQDACAACLSGDPGTREHGRGTARRPVPTPGGLQSCSGPLHVCVSLEACPLGHRYHDKLVGCFHSRTGCLSLLLLVPREWQPIKNIFSTGCMPMGPASVSLMGHQSQSTSKVSLVAAIKSNIQGGQAPFPEYQQADVRQGTDSKDDTRPCPFPERTPTGACPSGQCFKGKQIKLYHRTSQRLSAGGLRCFSG